jgi:enoyl-CoA hydratase/carnithine racemase
MVNETLIVERDGAVAVVTVNRPAVLNALNTLTIAEIERTMIALRDDPSVRAIVLTGAGEKAFVAGADIKELSTLSPVAGQAYARAGQRVFDLIENLGKPVVAAINGFALGGGCELAMACTLRLAAETAKLGQPEVRLGLIPGFGGTQRLSRLVGKGRALQIILTGDPIDAQEAWRIGLVNRVVPAADLLAEAKSLALALAGRAPIALRYAIDAVNHGLEATFAEGCVLEASLFGLVASTDDMREGTQAFIEKRRADFKGR